MADNQQQQTLIVNGDLSLADDISEVELSAELPQKNVELDPSSDILQRALDEAGGYEQNLLDRSHGHNSVLQDNIQHLTDHSYIHCVNSSLKSSHGSVSSKDLTASECSANTKDLDLINVQFSSIPDVNNTQDLDLSSTFSNGDAKVNSNNVDVEKLNIVEDNILSGGNLIINNSVNTEISSSLLTEPQNTVNQNLQFILKQNIQSIPSVVLSSGSLTSVNSTIVKLPIKQINAPVGSVKNPIQVIQNRGRSYTTTQVLTQAQLQQITHVLQRQQAKKIANGGKASISFEPNTQTRIICRLVDPSEVHSKNSKLEILSRSNTQGSVAGRGRGRPKKSFCRKLDEDERANSLLSKEEREEKKKHRPRTRSGRISKPPSYMVKDYKRIHHLDFNEDANDDSDGGYSDYHVSDEENGKRNKLSNLPPGVTTAKQRNFSCASCSKAYIGKGGLSRHYRLNPTHGCMPEGEGDISTQDENSNSSLASSVLSNSGANTNCQTNPVTLQNPAKTEVVNLSMHKQIPQSQTNSLLDRRKARLQEILKNYSINELVDVLLPKFACEVSLWKFFTTKCDKQSDALSIFEMLKEFEKFLAQMQRLSLLYLSPSTEEDQGKTIINISSKQIAEALSLERGSYAVKNPISTSSNLKSNDFSYSNMNISSTELDATDDMLHSYRKRKRVDSNVVDVSAGLPEQILSDVHENSNIDLPMSEETLSENINIHQHQLHTCKEELQRDSIQKHLYDLNSSTIVTPSSLSSGCLSAVNSSNFPKGHMFTNPNDVQHFQNLQVRKVSLLGNSLQNQVSNNMAFNGFPMSSDNLSDLQIQGKNIIVTHSQAELCNDSSGNSGVHKAFQALNMDSAVSIFNSCQELSQTNMLDCQQSSANIVPSASLLNNLNISSNCMDTSSQETSNRNEVSDNLSNCLVVADVAHSLENPTTSISGNEMHSCLISTSSTETGQYQVTQSEVLSDNITPSKSTVLRQLMLPDGQVIEVWSAMDNSVKPAGEEIVPGFLPGNLIILQNVDGSIQVPQNQGAALETLNALASADSALPEQATSLTYTTVNM